MLTSLSLFGKAHATGLFLDREDHKQVDFLTKFMSKSKYSNNKSTYLSCAKYFDEGGEGNNSPFQVEAFLAYWLPYFFLSSPEDGLHNYVFPMVILHASANLFRWHWRPCSWAIFYARLKECSKNVVKSCKI